MIIGISLGTATTEEFKVLLGALGFHQFFEGLGLGQVLAETQTSQTKDRNGCVYFSAYVSATLYAISTPLGVAIGIGIASAPETTGRYSYCYFSRIVNLRANTFYLINIFTPYF